MRIFVVLIFHFFCILGILSRFVKNPTGANLSDITFTSSYLKPSWEVLVWEFWKNYLIAYFQKFMNFPNSWNDPENYPLIPNIIITSDINCHSRFYFFNLFWLFPFFADLCAFNILGEKFRIFLIDKFLCELR